MDSQSAFFAGLGVGVAALAVAVLLAWIMHSRVVARINKRYAEQLESARSVSVRQSRATLGGKMAEQLAPFLNGFKYVPSDCKFLGDPIDYVVFRGLTEHRHVDGPADQIEIVFLDVKSGKSQLSRWQRAIVAAVQSGRVRFEVGRVNEDKSEVVHVQPVLRNGRDMPSGSDAGDS